MKERGQNLMRGEGEDKKNQNITAKKSFIFCF